MVRLMEILVLVIDRLKRDNPYGFVFKGGTALAVHHLPGHRESEDLDFDVPSEHMEKIDEITMFIAGSFEALIADGTIRGFRVTKQGFASTDRYHMSIVLDLHRPYHTKVDLNFTDVTSEVEHVGELLFYTAERMFVSKLLTFHSRGEFKDFFDIHHLLTKVRTDRFSQPSRVADLIEKVLGSSDEAALVRSYSRSFRNVDLRFKNLREREIGGFVQRTLRELKKMKNQLGK